MSQAGTPAQPQQVVESSTPAPVSAAYSYPSYSYPAQYSGLQYPGFSYAPYQYAAPGTSYLPAQEATREVKVESSTPVQYNFPAAAPSYYTSYLQAPQVSGLPTEIAKEGENIYAPQVLPYGSFYASPYAFDPYAAPVQQTRAAPKKVKKCGCS